MSNIRSLIAYVHSLLGVTGKYYRKQQMLLKEQGLNEGGEVLHFLKDLYFHLQGFKCF